MMPTMNKAQQEFASDRSHAASDKAYDLCKTISQTTMLINGGAATAMLALLSKDKVDPLLYAAMPYALAGYGWGVFISAIMLFSVMMMADHWNYFWYYVCYDKNDEFAAQSEKVANRWHWAVYICFGFAMVGFLCGSGVIAKSLFDSTKPQTTTPITQPAVQKK